MKVYLGGPINGCTDEEAIGWREAVKRVLAEQGHSWRDPMRHDFRGREQEQGSAELIVGYDKTDIENSDLALFNCPRPSWGAAMEILWAWLAHVPAVVVLPEGVDASPWLQYHATVEHGQIVDVARRLA